MKRLLLLLLLSMIAVGGCLLDDDDDDSDDKINSIDQLTVGGGLFIFREQGLSIAQFGTFNGKNSFDDAWVYVNGVKLYNDNGIYTKLQYFVDDVYKPGSTVHIAVYAFGDSIITDITVPDDPIIIEPAGDISTGLDEELLVNIAYPGKNDYSAISLANFADGWELDADKTITIPFPANTFSEPGEEQMNAYAVNTSDTVPEDFTDFNQQYELFLVAATASRKITFTEAEKTGQGN